MNSLVGPDERCLVVVAAPVEARAILAGFRAPANIPDLWNVFTMSPSFDLLVSGVGKSNAAGATARALTTRRYRSVINMGICGALPVAEMAQVGQVVLASVSAFADEGIDLGADWMPLSKAGFSAAIDGESVAGAEAWRAKLRTFSDREGPLATVSACSGNDAAAHGVALRRVPGAIAEAMEGAAVGVAAVRCGALFAEWRVVSNRTGDRAAQGWDIPKAAARLEELATELARIG